jgi:osmotically-inducible protein OsmY
MAPTNMKFKTLIAVAVCAAPMALFAADPAADNTEKNDRDRSGETLTPIDQSNDAADIKITADARKMVVGDDSLSSNAKNCKIITTKAGAVTLRGPVDSAAEKAKIAEYATKAGASSVTNQLEVKETK